MIDTLAKSADKTIELYSWGVLAVIAILILAVLFYIIAKRDKQQSHSQDKLLDFYENQIDNQTKQFSDLLKKIDRVTEALEASTSTMVSLMLKVENNNQEIKQNYSEIMRKMDNLEKEQYVIKAEMQQVKRSESYVEV